MAGSVVPEPSLSLTGTPTSKAQLPCDRCGTFIQGEPKRIGEKQVCEPCLALLRKEIKLYPYQYVLVAGCLVNFGIAAILSAINWKRLGDTKRFKSSIALVVIAVAYVVLATSVDLPRGVSIGANVGGTLGALQGFKELYAQHKQQGGARANLVWPTSIMLGIVALAVIGLLGIMSQGYDPESAPD